uniref:Odorant receptor n=1 Tax=Colaphellus bowringi TaxID=561076 RepID=A0A0S3J2U5_9CUCU|nr:odorant receptor OR32 [Colaphellus bowringi]
MEEDQKIYHFKTLKYILILMGQWKFRNRSRFFIKLYELIISRLVVAYLILSAHMFLINVAFAWDCKARVMEMLTAYMQNLNVIIVTLIMRSQRMRNVLRYVQHYENIKLKDENIAVRDIYMQYVSINHKICRLLIGVVVFTALFYFATGMRNSFLISSTEECPMMKGIMFQLWYPMDTKKYFYLVVLNDNLIIINIVITIIHAKGLIIANMIFAISQMKILQYELTLVGQIEQETDEDVELRVKKCIMIHQEIARMMDLFVSASKDIILMQYFITSSELALYLLQMMLADSFAVFGRLLMNFIYLFVEVFLLFWCANNVLVESMAISDVIYNESNWITLSNGAKKDMLMMLSRAQVPMAFKATFVGNISLETFTKLLKLCYSVVAFLSNVVRE